MIDLPEPKPHTYIYDTLVGKRSHGTMSGRLFDIFCEVQHVVDEIWTESRISLFIHLFTYLSVCLIVYYPHP